MGRSKQSQEIYEEQEGSTKLAKVLTAVALYGAALLLGYVAVATPESGTAMGAIRNVLCGLGGSLAVVIPIMFAWMATLAALSAAGKQVSVWKSVVDGVLFVCLFTAVHLFFAETIIRTRMTISGFANFVSKSYSYGYGGGAIGALLTWPLYQSLGKWGGLLAAILLALLSLTATGKAARFVRWSIRTGNAIQHRSEQRRYERESEQMFDFDEPEPDSRVRRAGKAADSPVDSVYIGGGDFAAPPSRRRKDAGSAPRRGFDEDLYPTLPAGARRSDDLRPGESRSRRSAGSEAAAESMVVDDPRGEAPKSRRGRKPAAEMVVSDSRSETDINSRRRGEGRLYNMVTEEERAAKSRRKKTTDDLFDIKETTPEGSRPVSGGVPSQEESLLDDVSEVESVPVAFDRKKRKTGYQPDTSESVEKLRGMKAKDGQLRMDDDLTIEPDHSDVLENDDPPFDVPEKKPLPKFKRTPAPAPEAEESEYYYPPIDLLAEGECVDENHRDSDMQKAALLENTLKEFGISSKLTGIAHGPAVTRFELQPAPGVKVSRITALADDIAMRLAAMSVRIEAPIPGKAAVGVEIPNEKVEMVRLRDVLESAEARKSTSKVAVGLGKDNSGRYIVADVAKMPHVLIAGQTGSGKSVCINSIITSILFRATPDEVRLILIDPKVVELSVYNDIPHLVCPVVTDCKKAASALDWAVAEMTMRYKRFAERGVRDIKGYNKELREDEKPMPQMVIIIDELADLMMVAPGEVEDSICRLAQLARAAGMHLVIATQRPSVNVVTGIIKANIPTRIAFSVASQIDSRTMIDHGGAEKLLGNGDMLFVPNGINKPMRVQGAWVSDEEVHAIVSYIKERSETAYDVNMIEQMDNAARTDAEKEEFTSEYDPRLPEAVEIVVEAGQASVSMLQRRMRVGYARAGRLIDEMEQRGIVSEADGAKPRTVLITREEMEELFEDDE